MLPSEETAGLSGVKYKGSSFDSCDVKHLSVTGDLTNRKATAEATVRCQSQDLPVEFSTIWTASYAFGASTEAIGNRAFSETPFPLENMTNMWVLSIHMRSANYIVE